MKFRSEYVAVKADFSLSPAKPVILLGSCFAENIGGRMRDCLWEASNPFGTLYNPLSIATALSLAIEQIEAEERGCLKKDSVCIEKFEESLFEADGFWRSWLFDSKMSAEKKEDVRFAFRERCREMDAFLRQGEVVFVTFGTSWCYYLKDDCSGLTSGSENQNYLVANCHKRPARLFTRLRLTVDEIVSCWKRIISRLRERYPQLRIVFTVSPVRHLKDGLVGNKRSKAILLLAVEELCEKVERCSYFPAYEIVNDDLRDYRFYASDLAHPSEEAVEYIWEKFRDMYISLQGSAMLKEGESIRRGLEHRPLPNATRQPSAEAVKKEEARIATLTERKITFLEEKRNRYSI